MRGRQSACCFTGHRPSKLPWGRREDDFRCQALKARLWDAVETAWETGFTHFICGMARGCDFYACECVIYLREIHPDVTIEAAIPCPTQADNWQAADRMRYRHLVQQCDYETVVSNEYMPSCMQRRDRYMVDHASMLIAMYNGTAGGTRYTVEYALRRKIDIVNLPLL